MQTTATDVPIQLSYGADKYPGMVQISYGNPRRLSVTADAPVDLVAHVAAIDRLMKQGCDWDCLLVAAQDSPRLGPVIDDVYDQIVGRDLPQAE